MAKTKPPKLGVRAWISEAIARAYPDEAPQDTGRNTHRAVDAFAAGWREGADPGLTVTVDPTLRGHKNAGFQAYHSGSYSFDAAGLDKALHEYVGKGK